MKTARWRTKDKPPPPNYATEVMLSNDEFLTYLAAYQIARKASPNAGGDIRAHRNGVLVLI